MMKEIINIEIQEKQNTTLSFKELQVILFSKKYIFLFTTTFLATLCILFILKSKNPTLNQPWQAKVIVQSNYNEMAKKLSNSDLNLDKKSIKTPNYLFYFFIKEIKSLNYLAKTNPKSTNYRLMNVKVLDPSADLFEFSLKAKTKEESIADLNKNLEIASERLTGSQSINNKVFKMITRLDSKELKQKQYQLTFIHITLISLLIGFFLTLAVASSNLAFKKA